MELTITVPSEVERILEQKAAASGQDVKAFVESMVTTQALRPTLDEILAPIRQGFAESGMTEDELDGFLNEVREEVWQEKQARERET